MKRVVTTSEFEQSKYKLIVESHRKKPDLSEIFIELLANMAGAM